MDSSPETAPTSPGDTGFTSLPGQPRLAKSHELICALGALDELNAALGLLRAVFDDDPAAAGIEAIQRELLALGRDLATGQATRDPDPAAALADDIARMNQTLPRLNTFLLPGVCERSARAHWARTVCRRTERDLVRACKSHPERIGRPALAYLNRLSTWLFALARTLDHCD